MSFSRALTLIQIGTIRQFPLLLSPSAPWGGLLGRLAEETLAAQRVGASELTLRHRCDNRVEVVRLAHAEQNEIADSATRQPPLIAAVTPEP